MATLAKTPKPPYYAVVFFSLLASAAEGYATTADRMLKLVEQQEGFLGVDSAREGELGITVSYWRSLEDIRKWKEQAEHRLAQESGKRDWYSAYQIRICLVQNECAWKKT